MGEVFRGYDDRLDRHVALKRVRPGVGDPAVALKRFRREARAAARLHHPAIVQVHDWVEEEDGAWLVMELVEGRALRQILREGALAPKRALALTRDILEGLAVAHDAGLVHRDLKIDNIMVTPTSSGRGRIEQAKILDFGLAKDTSGEVDETHLSMEGKIVGTLSALAPEQVLGEKVDPRTDLFALGCLLYEVLTEKRPFTGRSAGETLNRICSFYQVPVSERRPEVPEDVSQFVDVLLEKDPRRRPSSAVEALKAVDGLESIAALQRGDNDPSMALTKEALTLQDLDMEGRRSASDTILDRPAGTPSRDPPPPGAAPFAPRAFLWLSVAAILGTILFWWWHRAPASMGPIYVAVPSTQIEGELGVDTLTLDAARGPDLELTALAIRSALVQSLIDRSGLVPIEVSAEEEHKNVQSVARSLAADEVLSSRIRCTAKGCRAELRRISGKDSRVLWAQGFAVDPTRLFDTHQAILGHLANAFAGFQRRENAALWQVDPPDYASFLTLEKQFETRGRGLSTELFLSELDRLAESSPHFAAIPVLRAHVLLQRFQVSREASDLATAESSVDQARKLAPDDPKVLMLAARAARLAGRFEEALSILDRVRSLEPGDGQALLQQALLAERLAYANALDLAAEAVDRHPSVNVLLNASDLCFRLGEIDRARTYIEAALERSPRSFGGLSRLATLELSHGDLDRAAELYRELVRRSPEEPELTNLGTAYLLLGRFDEAADSLRRVVDSNPGSPFATLNLADVEKLRGAEERARELYAQVVELAQADPEPERLASATAQALAHLGRNQEAVATLQTAIRNRPDDPWAAYEAALVHTLVEDRSSAIWHARRALTLGVEPRWLDLPFFNPIREEIEGGP